MDTVVSGESDSFRKLAGEIDLNSPSSGNDLVGQLEGVDLILKNDVVTIILYLRQREVGAEKNYSVFFSKCITNVI